MHQVKHLLMKLNNVQLFQEKSCEADEKCNVKASPAVIQIDDPSNFSVSAQELEDGKARTILQMNIDAEIFDEIAIEWCKQLKLHGALGGPVGREWGSPDCDFED